MPADREADTADVQAMRHATEALIQATHVGEPWQVSAAQRAYDDALDSLAAALRTAEEAKAWYEDHKSAEGVYDEAVWGNPFHISPQLRAALGSEAQEDGGKR